MAQLVGYPGGYSQGDTTVVDTAQKVPLRTRGFDAAGNEYIYLQGVASTAQGSWVAYDELGQTLLLDTDVAATLVSPVAVAQAAVVVNTFGWYCIFGSTSGLVLASFADASKIFAVTTAGSVDDAGTGGNQVVGAYGRSAIASGQATVQLSYPVVGVDVA